MHSLSIIGAGKLGRSVGRVLHAAGVCAITDIVNRSKDSARAACAFIGAGRALARFDDLLPADIFMLAVSDDAIIDACAQLARVGVLKPGTIVFHCSGAKASDVLRVAKVCGAHVASVHPVRSFADPAIAAAEFAGTSICIEGDTPALAVLQTAFSAIGGQILQIQAQAKLLYHAAAVFANNYLVTLLDTAQRCYLAAGLSEAQAQTLSADLARQALDNVRALGTHAALTGPIARRDWALVQAQQARVAEWDDEAAALYAAFVQTTRRLAERTSF